MLIKEKTCIEFLLIYNLKALFFFYKHDIYKYEQPQIWQKIKHDRPKAKHDPILKL